MAHQPDIRSHMVEAQITRRGVLDQRVLEAMRDIRREDFVDPGLRELAYQDSALPIAEGQTISQPYIVARMAEAAEIEPGDRVLEIGTGSGYGAAILARLAAKVFTIERLPALAELARARLQRYGLDNVVTQIGDGSKGYPEAAPFDAIVVTAGGPSIPVALQEQLEVGGRLIIPVGVEGGQRLLRVVRTGANSFEEEDLGGVMFVPLIGEQGWSDQHARRPSQSRSQVLARLAEDLPSLDDSAFADAFERFADRRVILLGEATHGTSEFYRARAAISRRLIERHGFRIVAVEADWPDAMAVNRHVRGLGHRPGSPLPFERFPRWMWRNLEVAEFVAWLHEHNAGLESQEEMAGFYGLDLYNMHASIDAVLAYLDKTDPEAARAARERYVCLAPWQHDPASYGRAVLTERYRQCEEEAVRQCRELFLQRFEGQNGIELLDARASARLIASAEKYYRVMYYGGAESWNLRDRHMFETLEQLLETGGPDARAIVWAHNSHIGDARETDMGRVRDEINLGQLCKDRFGRDAVSIGFGTDTGEVAAADEWGGAMRTMPLRPVLDESFERLCRETGKSRFLVDFSAAGALSERLDAACPQRFIGVVYRPEMERLSHYMDASVSRQYDAYVWFRNTSAVAALETAAPRGHQMPDTYPFGL